MRSDPALRGGRIGRHIQRSGLGEGPWTHWRVRHDLVDSSGKVTLRHNGRLHHIGLGRTQARTPIVLLVADLDIHVIHATTGELLRHLTFDPTRDYQPTGRPPRPHPKTTTALPPMRVQAVRQLLRDHIGGGDGIRYRSWSLVPLRATLGATASTM